MRNLKVKISLTPILDSVQILSDVLEKQDGDKGGQGSHPQSKDPRKDEKDGQNEPFDDGKFKSAIAEFKTENAAMGLDASVSGQGPGLKVTLKDVNGSVVRQFTGEEFLKLRQASRRDGTQRGKILDQKL